MEKSTVPEIEARVKSKSKISPSVSGEMGHLSLNPTVHHDGSQNLALHNISSIMNPVQIIRPPSYHTHKQAGAGIAQMVQLLDYGFDSRQGISTVLRPALGPTFIT
jgi:hypothetical protein